MFQQVYRCLPTTSKLVTRRGMRVLSRPVLDASGKPGKSSVHSPFGSCSCSMCSAPTKNGVEDENSDLLKATMDKNKYLEEEIAKLRLQVRQREAYEEAAYGNMTSEDPDIAKLLENNKKWVDDQNARDPKFFERVGGPQHPKYLYIGCADSRVPANQILGLGPGEVFVHRNVGNQVIGSDLNCLSSIEFAVKYLGVKHIIVAGHYDCGAVRAAMTKQDLGLLENWIRSIRDVYRIHQHSMTLVDDPEERHRRMVEYNVIEQCLNLYKTGVVQSTRMNCIKRGDTLAYPRIHAMVFDPKVGVLKKLPVNFKKVIAQFKDIYDMY